MLFASVFICCQAYTGAPGSAVLTTLVLAPFPSYHGDEPYVFVCYSHADSERVYADLVWLRECGFNIWYDEGISPGSRWRDEAASAIERASAFLFYISPGSAESPHCN